MNKATHRLLREGDEHVPQSLGLGSARGSSLATGMKHHSTCTQGLTEGLPPIQPLTPIPAVLLLLQPPNCSPNMLQKGMLG